MWARRSWASRRHDHEDRHSPFDKPRQPSGARPHPRAGAGWAQRKAAATAQEQTRKVVDSALVEAQRYWAEDRLARLGIPMPDES